MPETNPYRIFVTHAWEDHEDYQRLFDYLGDATNFYYASESHPDIAPKKDATRLELEQMLSQQISAAEVVIALGGIFEQHPDPVTLQVAIARKFAKPVIALYQFGSHRMPDELEEKATEVVIWNERMIVDAIKKHGRGEEGDRFEVIDFDM